MLTSQGATRELGSACFCIAMQAHLSSNPRPASSVGVHVFIMICIINLIVPVSGLTGIFLICIHDVVTAPSTGWCPNNASDGNRQASPQCSANSRRVQWKANRVGLGVIRHVQKKCTVLAKEKSTVECVHSCNTQHQSPSPATPLAACCSCGLIACGCRLLAPNFHCCYYLRKNLLCPVIGCATRWPQLTVLTSK